MKQRHHLIYFDSLMKMYFLTNLLLFTVVVPYSDHFLHKQFPSKQTMVTIHRSHYVLKEAFKVIFNETIDGEKDKSGETKEFFIQEEIDL